MKEIGQPSLVKALGTVVSDLPKLNKAGSFSPEEAEKFAASATTVLERIPKPLIKSCMELYVPFRRLYESTRVHEGKNNDFSYMNKNFRNALMGVISYLQDDINPQFLQNAINNVLIRNKGLIKGQLAPSEKRKKAEEKLGIKIPWAVAVDVTSTCNINPPCEGCYAGKFSKNDDPSFRTLDKLIGEAKDLGMSTAILLGGEPLVRESEIIEIEKKHPELNYWIFTNGTLIKESTAQEFLQTGASTIFLFHLEGAKENTDKYMSPGVFDKSIASMNILRKAGLPFGFSIQVNRSNFSEVIDKNFTNFLQEQGCMSGIYFPYVPLGKNPDPALALTSEQKLQLRAVTNELRKKGMLVASPEEVASRKENCIAGTRYVSITSQGELKPCVFIDASDTNVYKSNLPLGETLASSLLIRACQAEQKDCRSCLARDRKEVLGKIVASTGAHSIEIQ